MFRTFRNGVTTRSAGGMSIRRQMTELGRYHVDIAQWAIGDNPIEIENGCQNADRCERLQRRY